MGNLKGKEEFLFVFWEFAVFEVFGGIFGVLRIRSDEIRRN